MKAVCRSSPVPLGHPIPTLLAPKYQSIQLTRPADLGPQHPATSYFFEIQEFQTLFLISKLNLCIYSSHFTGGQNIPSTIHPDTQMRNPSMILAPLLSPVLSS